VSVSMPSLSTSSLQDALPIRYQLSQSPVTVASQKLDRVGRHVDATQERPYVGKYEYDVVS